MKREGANRALNLSPIGILPAKKIKKFKNKSSVVLQSNLHHRQQAERKSWRYSLDFESSKMSNNRQKSRKVDFTDSMILVPQ